MSRPKKRVTFGFHAEDRVILSSLVGKASPLWSHLIADGGVSWGWTILRILYLKFSLNPLRFSFTIETDTKMTRAILAKLQFLNDKLTKTPIFLNCQAPNVFLSVMSRARASRDLSQLFCFLNKVVCRHFGLFVRIFVCLPESLFVLHSFKNLENIFYIQISLKTRKLMKVL